MIRDSKNSDPLVNDERRATRRFATNRPARFSDAAGAGPLHSGRVVEMSPCGLRMESFSDAEPGERLELEIEAEDSGDITVLRGEVMYSAPAHRGKFNIGIEAHFTVPKPPAVVARARTEREFPVAARSTIPSKPLPPKPLLARSRRRRLLLILALALLLPGLAVVVESTVAATGNGNALNIQKGLVADADQEVLYFTGNASRTLKAITRTAPGFPRTHARLLAQPVQTDSASREGVPGQVNDETASWPERAARGLPGRGEAITRDGGTEQINARAAADSDTEGNLILIEVDTANYVLHVRRNNAIVRSFPIGLGRDGATPLGRFEVVHKIADPDWYDRGTTVPAGSPDNPLGASWMGLGNDGRGTGIGIHPAADNESILQPMSRGCIRMNPADAEALFRLAPAGTPVWVRE